MATYLPSDQSTQCVSCRGEKKILPVTGIEPEPLNSGDRFTWSERDSSHHHHQSLKREGRWGTTDDFATSFLHFSLFSTALWDLPNSKPVHSLMLSSHLFLCLSCLLPPFTVPCKMVLARPYNGKHDRTTAVCISLPWSGGLYVVHLPSGSWHVLVGNMVFA